MAAKGRSGRWASTMTATVAAALVTAGITAALHARVDDPGERPGRDAMPVATVDFEEVAAFEREQRFLGLVKAATSGTVGFEIPGAIEAILVDEGERVAAGTPLARLDTRSLEARRKAAAATVAQVRAELELARARSERQAPLAASGAISRQNFDDTRLGEKALVARLEAVTAELDSLTIDLDKSVLRAPYAALVGRQHLDRGTVTAPGRAVFTLVATGAREAQVGIAVEQAGTLAVDRVYPLELRGETIDARLRGIRPDVDPLSMTAAAIFVLPAGTEAFDGEPVTISLPRRVAASGGWLPLSALLEGERGVWTVLALRERAGDTVALREVVEVLHVSGDRAFVRGTLNDGDRVIADGIHRVAPGTRVTDSAGDRLAGA